MGCVCPSFVVGLTTVCVLVGGADPWPSWLQGCALCCSCYCLLWGRTGSPVLINWREDSRVELISNAVITVEWAPPKWLLPMSLSPRGVPVASCLTKRLSKITSLIQAYFRVLPLCWDLEHVRFCKCPLRVKSVSCSPLALLNICPAGFQSQKCWGLVFLVHDNQAGEFDVMLRLLTLWGRTSMIKIFLLFVGYQIRGVWVLTILHLHPFYLSRDSFFMSVGVENLFC